MRDLVCSVLTVAELQFLLSYKLHVHHPHCKQWCLLHHKEGRKEKPQKKYQTERKINERGKRIYTEVCQVDTDDGTGDRSDAQVCQVDTDGGTGD